MVTLVANKNPSAPRVQKHRENMLKNGFKRVQKWVLDLESMTIQEKMKADLANYKVTSHDNELNDFVLEQMNDLEGWK